MFFFSGKQLWLFPKKKKNKKEQQPSFLCIPPSKCRSHLPGTDTNAFQHDRSWLAVPIAAICGCRPVSVLEVAFLLSHQQHAFLGFKKQKSTFSCSATVTPCVWHLYLAPCEFTLYYSHLTFINARCHYDTWGKRRTISLKGSLNLKEGRHIVSRQPHPIKGLFSLSGWPKCFQDFAWNCVKIRWIWHVRHMLAALFYFIGNWENKRGCWIISHASLKRTKTRLPFPVLPTGRHFIVGIKNIAPSGGCGWKERWASVVYADL